MKRISILLIAIFFMSGGIAHFVYQNAFIAVMPAYLGFHRELVLISGVCELLGAVGMLLPRTRKFAGYGLIALAVAVFPANVNMALHPELTPNVAETLLCLRLPLQFLLIWLIAWAVSENSYDPSLSAD